MNNIINVVNFLISLYCFFLSFFLETNNFKGTIVFKFTPFIIGIFLLFEILFSNGTIIINF